MAAPRAVQFIALRNLQRTASRQQSRSLHMTGPATYASPFLSTDRGNPNVSRDLSKSTRTKPSTQEPSSRNFNTSRTLKQVNDSSPIDFAYFDSVFSPSDVEVVAVQVPVLPEVESKQALNRVEDEGVVAMKSEVYSVAPDSIILPLSDHSTPLDEYMHIDFRSFADKVADGVDSLVADVVSGKTAAAKT